MAEIIPFPRPLAGRGCPTCGPARTVYRYFYVGGYRVDYCLSHRFCWVASVDAIGHYRMDAGESLYELKARLECNA